MPRPAPLLSERPYSSNYDIQPLTPRTPHSRAGRAEEQPVDDEDYELEVIHGLGDHNDQFQQEPLLASSASASFPHRIRTFEDSERERKYKRVELTIGLILSRLPLVAGASTAMLLLFLVVLSIKRPELLQHAIGINPTGVSDIEPNTADEPSASAPAMKTAPILSYENYTTFPLSAMEYRNECTKWFSSRMNTMNGYWGSPPEGAMDVLHHDEDFTQKTHLPEAKVKKVCKSTVTYMLDGHVGLAADLALMAQTAGLAREQGRTFFVNDQYWNRGKWLDHFQDVRHLQPGPEPGCLPPPAEELVACPRVARHWVINSRTALFHFGHMFDDEFEDPHSQQLRRKKPIFDRSAESFSQTIRPNAEVAALIRSARKEISSSLEIDKEALSQRDLGMYVGVHIRRGDRKAEAWPHRGDYVPIPDFVQATRESWVRLLSGSVLSPSQAGPVIWIASDSPVAQNEFVQILLNGSSTAVVFSLSRSQNEELQQLESRREYVQKEFNAYPLEDRVSLTKGELVDFALLSGAWAWEEEARSMASICTLSSNICKMAAVGLGWERAFGFESEPEKGTELQMDIDNDRKRWVDVDSRGTIEPAWRAFELF